jgi:hypothetical protein
MWEGVEEGEGLWLMRYLGMGLFESDVRIKVNFMVLRMNIV